MHQNTKHSKFYTSNSVLYVINLTFSIRSHYLLLCFRTVSLQPKKKLNQSLMDSSLYINFKNSDHERFRKQGKICIYKFNRRIPTNVVSYFDKLLIYRLLERSDNMKRKLITIAGQLEKAKVFNLVFKKLFITQNAQIKKRYY